MRTLVVGGEALLIELGSAAEVAALHAELLRRREAGELGAVRDLVPAARTVLLDGVRDPAGLGARIARWEVPPLTRTQGPLVTVPVRYDGPDLAEAARLWGWLPKRSRTSSAAPSSGWRSAGSPPASAT